MSTIPNTFVANQIAHASEVNENFVALEAAVRPTFVFTIVGTLAVGTSVTPAIVVPKTLLTIDKAFAYVKTSPAGASIIFDILKNGTSIWSSNPGNRVLITAGSQSGTQTSFDTTSLTEGDILTVSVIQVGSTTAGSDGTIQLRCS